MATGKELSLDNLDAAKLLLAEGRLRSSVSRSCYAAYCAVSHRLSVKGVQFARGWNNPAHEQLLALIRNGLALPHRTRQPLLQAIRRLRFARESADYKPRESVDRVLALGCLHDTAIVLRIWED